MTNRLSEKEVKIHKKLWSAIPFPSKGWIWNERMCSSRECKKVLLVSLVVQSDISLSISSVVDLSSLKSTRIFYCKEIPTTTEQKANWHERSHKPLSTYPSRSPSNIQNNHTPSTLVQRPSLWPKSLKPKILTKHYNATIKTTQDQSIKIHKLS